jgi:hypothetical protein
MKLCGLFSVLALGLLAPAAGAEPYAVGSELPPLSLEDQHGESHTLDGSVRVVLFSRDMDAGKVIQQALSEDGQALLDAHSAAYVADVSRMPGLVRRMIAKPRMRKRPYLMWLDEEGDATADLPSEEGLPTLLFLEDRRILRIHYPATPEALREALSAPQPALPSPE